jgi:hypothetical protein
VHIATVMGDEGAVVVVVIVLGHLVTMVAAHEAGNEEWWRWPGLEG